MPSIATRSPGPQVVEDSLSRLPQKLVPELPADLLKRFPSLRKWEEDKDALWSRANAALQSNQGTVSQTVAAVRSEGVSLRRAFVTSEGTFSAALLTEQTVRANADFALASQITTLEADFDSDLTAVNAAITLEQTTRATADTALALSITTLTSTVSNNLTTVNAAIASEALTRATDDTAIAATVTALTSTVSGNLTTVNAAIAAEASTRATNDTAIAGTVTALTSTVSSNLSTVNAAIASEASTRSSADTAIAGTVTALTSTVSSNLSTVNAAIASEASTRATNDTAIAGTVTTLAATVSSNYTTLAASVTTEASARATADGHLAGKYTLTVVAGDVITGMNITSSTGSGTNISSVIFQADRFQIWNGSSAVPVFDLNGSDVTIAGFTITPTYFEGGSGITRIRVQPNAGTGAGIICGDFASSTVSTNMISTSFDVYEGAQVIGYLGTVGSAGSRSGYVELIHGPSSTPRVILGASTGFGTFAGTVTANLFSGSGASLTSLPAANLTGTIDNTRLPSAISVTSLAGSGASITSLSATNISSGTLDNARLPSAISVTSLAGSGSGITNLDASNITSGVLNLTSGSPHRLADTTIATGGIELCTIDSGDRVSAIDFHSSNAVDYSTRLIRNPGVNGVFEIIQTGSGRVEITASAGFYVNGVLIAA